MFINFIQRMLLWKKQALVNYHNFCINFLGLVYFKALIGLKPCEKLDHKKANQVIRTRMFT